MRVQILCRLCAPLVDAGDRLESVSAGQVESAGASLFKSHTSLAAHPVTFQVYLLRTMP